MIPPTNGELIAERYRIEGLLGRGGMGVVLAAQNIVTGKSVALKWLSPSDGVDARAMQRLVREARIAARIRHPNIVDVYDVGEHGGALFLVMERLDGQPLSNLMKAGPVDPAALVATLLPAMRGLAAVHRGGVLHRDLKPSNIFLCQDDRGQALESKLLDFGVSTLHATSDGDREPTLTRTGAIIGTPQFMAPEQLDEARPVDHRADIYAVGVLLYKGLCGEMPHQAESYSTLVLRVTTGDHVPLVRRCPHLSRPLCDAVEQAMALDPQDRFADAESLIVALEPFAGQVLLHADRPSPGTVDPDPVQPEAPTKATPKARAMTPEGLSATTLDDGTSPSESSDGLSAVKHSPETEDDRNQPPARIAKSTQQSRAATERPRGSQWLGATIGIAFAVLFALGALLWSAPKAEPIEQPEQTQAPDPSPVAGPIRTDKPVLETKPVTTTAPVEQATRTPPEPTIRQVRLAPGDSNARARRARRRARRTTKNRQPAPATLPATTDAAPEPTPRRALDLGLDEF